MKSSRREFLLSAAACGVSPGMRPLFGAVASSLVKPTPQQVLWADQELGMFFHMDLPIFQPRGKGVNTEHCQKILDPRIYNPAKLNTDQWMEAAKAMGAKYVVFVAYHGSGFMQWQSDLFPYGLKQSPWRGGKGDVVRDFMDSARKYGMKPGLYAYARGGRYLSEKFPVKRADGSVDKAAQKAKSKMIEGYLEELWRDYGEFFELWYDGGVLPVSQDGPDVERSPAARRFSQALRLLGAFRAHARAAVPVKGAAVSLHPQHRDSWRQVADCHGRRLPLRERRSGGARVRLRAPRCAGGRFRGDAQALPLARLPQDEGGRTGAHDVLAERPRPSAGCRVPHRGLSSQLFRRVREAPCLVAASRQARRRPCARLAQGEGVKWKVRIEKRKMKGETNKMKPKVVIALSAALLATAPLVAENVNGFENFVLSRNDYKSNPSRSITGFSSRTHTESSWDLAFFSSREATGTFITIR